MNEQMPPQDQDAERFLLGAVLRDSTVRADLLSLVKETDFYFDAHQKIWRCVAEMFGAGKPVDTVAICGELRRREWIDDVGGYGYLAELLDSAPTAFGWEYHAKTVKGLSVLRQIIHGVTQVLHDSYRANQDPDDIVCELQRLAFNLGEESGGQDTRHIRDVVTEAMRAIDRAATTRHGGGVLSGLIDLDDLTGGFHPGELCLLAARPSVGKTALSMQIVRHVATEGTGALVFSLEQSRTELVQRMFAGMAAVNSHAMRTGRLSPEDATRIGDVAEQLRELPIWINDSPTHRLLSLSSIARGLRASQGIGLIVVDYLQLLEPDDKRAKSHDQAEKLCKGLKQLARELEVPLICVTQLNRNPEHRTENKPRLSDLREAGEQPADTVLALWKEDTVDTGEIVGAAVLKQRNGPAGELSLLFVKRYLRFENMAVDDAFSNL